MLAVLKLPLNIRDLTEELCSATGKIVCMRGGTFLEVFDKKLLEKGYEVAHDRHTLIIENTAYRFALPAMLQKVIAKKDEKKEYTPVDPSVVKEEDEIEEVEKRSTASDASSSDVFSEGWESSEESIGKDDLELDFKKTDFPTISPGKEEI